MRLQSFALVSVLLTVVGCASRPASGPMLSKDADVVLPEAPPAAQILHWARLEAAVAEAAKEKGARLTGDQLRAASIAYALDINRVPVEDLRQYHVDRAAAVLERQVFTGVTLAEGSALRAAVHGGGAGSPTGPRGVGRSRRDTNRASGNEPSGDRTNSTRGF